MAARHDGGRDAEPWAAAIVRWGPGHGALLPDLSLTHGILNDTMFQIAPRDFIAVRNGWWRMNGGWARGMPGTIAAIRSA